MWGWLLLVIVAGLAIGFRAGRWRVLALAPAFSALTLLGPGGTDPLSLELAVLVFAPAALISLAAGVGAGRLLARADAPGGAPSQPPRARLAAGAAAAMLALVWLSFAWLALRAGIDRDVACNHEPCLGALAMHSADPRGAGDIAYGVIQAVVAAVGIVALAALVTRALTGTVRIGGPARVAAVALAVWLGGALAVDAARPSPAEAARSGDFVVWKPGDDREKLDACRGALRIPRFDLGPEYGRMRVRLIRCWAERGSPSYEVGYGTGQDSIWVSTTGPGQTQRVGCPPDPPDGMGLPVATVRGVTAAVGQNEITLYPRNATIQVDLAVSGYANPPLVANALRARGFPAGSRLPVPTVTTVCRVAAQAVPPSAAPH